MSLFTLLKSRKQPKVHHSQYIRTDDKPVEDETAAPSPQELPKPAVK